jgi:hypothetical protein
MFGLQRSDCGVTLSGVAIDLAKHGEIRRVSSPLVVYEISPSGQSLGGIGFLLTSTHRDGGGNQRSGRNGESVHDYFLRSSWIQGLLWDADWGIC